MLHRQYDTALEYHGEALLLCPYSPTTLTAIGYVYTLTERYTKAVEYFHKVSRTGVFVADTVRLEPCMVISLRVRKVSGEFYCWKSDTFN